MKAPSLRLLATLLLALRRESRSYYDGWGYYVEVMIDKSTDDAGSANMDKGAIIGLNGALWTPGNLPKLLQISSSEAAVISRCFREKDFTQFEMHGVVINGQKYQFIDTDEVNKDTVYARKRGHGFITMESTEQAVLIAHGPQGKQQGVVNDAVFDVAKYLKDSGY